jgi:hypothetical protein
VVPVGFGMVHLNFPRKIHSRFESVKEKGDTVLMFRGTLRPTYLNEKKLGVF